MQQLAVGGCCHICIHTGKDHNC